MASQTTIDLSHRNVSELDFSHHSSESPTSATTTRTVLFNDEENEDVQKQKSDAKREQQQLTVHERSLLARALILDASHNSITKLIGLSIFERLTVLDLSHNRLYIPNICVKKTSSKGRRSSEQHDYRPPSSQQLAKNTQVLSKSKQDGNGIASGLLVGGRLGGRKIVLDATPTRNTPGGKNSYIFVGSRAAAAPTVVVEPEDGNDTSDDEANDEHHSDNELWWITQLPKSIVSLNLSHNEIAVEIDTTERKMENGHHSNVLLDGWIAATFLHHLTALQILDLSHNFISTSTFNSKSEKSDEKDQKQLVPLVWNPHTGYPHLPQTSHTPTPSTLELLSLAHNRGICTINSSLIAGLDAITELHLEGTSVRRSNNATTRGGRNRHISTVDTDAVSNCLPCLMTLHLKGTPLDREVQSTPAFHRQFIEELANVGVRNLSLDIPSSSKSSAQYSGEEGTQHAQQPTPMSTTTAIHQAVSPSRQQRDIVVKPATFVISPKQNQDDDDESSSIGSSSSSLTSSDSDYSANSIDDVVEPAAVDFPSRDEDDLSAESDQSNLSSEDGEHGNVAHDQQHVLELLLKGVHTQQQQQRSDNKAASTSAALRRSRTSNDTDGFSSNKTTSHSGTEEERLLAKAVELEQQVLDVKARVFALRQLSAEQEDFLRATRKNVCEDLREMSELKVAVTTLGKIHQERGHLLSKRQRELKHASVTSRRFQEKLLIQEQLKIDKKMQRAEQRKRGLESLHEGRQLEQSGGLNTSRFSNGSPMNNHGDHNDGRQRASSSSPVNARHQSKSPQKSASSPKLSAASTTTLTKVSPRTRFVYDKFGNPTSTADVVSSPTTMNEASAVLQRMNPHYRGASVSVSPADRRGVVNYQGDYDEDESGSLSSSYHYPNASSGEGYCNDNGEEVLAVDTTTEIDTSHMEDVTSPRTPPEARNSITSANIMNLRGPGGGATSSMSGRNHLQVVNDDESLSHGGGCDASICSTFQLDVSDGRAVSYAEVFNSMSSMQPDYPQPSARLDDPARRVRNDSARKSYRDPSALQQQHERSMSGASNRSGSGGGKAGSAATATYVYEASGVLKSFNQYIDPNNSATATSTQRLSQTQREKAPYYRHTVQAHPFANISQNTTAVKAPHGGSKPFSLRTVLVDADRFSKHSGGTTDDFPLTTAMLATKTIHQQRTDRAASSTSAPRSGGGANTYPPNLSRGLLKESRELLQMLSRNLYHSTSGPEAGTIAAVASTPVSGRGGAAHRPAPSSSPGSRVASSSVSHRNSRLVSNAHQVHGSVAAERGSLVLEQAVTARSAPRLQ